MKKKLTIISLLALAASTSSFAQNNCNLKIKSLPEHIAQSKEIISALQKKGYIVTDKDSDITFSASYGDYDSISAAFLAIGHYQVRVKLEYKDMILDSEEEYFYQSYEKADIELAKEVKQEMIDAIYYLEKCEDVDLRTEV